MQNVRALLLILAVLATPVAAHNVTMNFAFSLPDASVWNGTNYIAVNKSIGNSSSVLALIFKGADLYSLSYSPAHIFRLVQAQADSRALLVLTQGSWLDIEAKSTAWPFPKGRFASSLIRGTAFDTFLLLQYTTVNIISNLSWSGSRTIAVRNAGQDRLPSIAFELVD